MHSYKWIVSVWVRAARNTRERAQPKADCATKIVRVYCTSASLSRMFAHVRPRCSLARSYPPVSLSRTCWGRAREFMRRFSSNEGPARSSSSDSSRTGDDASSRVSRSCFSLSLLLSHPVPSSFSIFFSLAVLTNVGYNSIAGHDP